MMSLIVLMMLSPPGTASDPNTKSCCISITISAGTKLGIGSPFMEIVVTLMIVVVQIRAMAKRSKYSAVLKQPSAFGQIGVNKYVRPKPRPSPGTTIYSTRFQEPMSRSFSAGANTSELCVTAEMRW